MVEWRKWQGLDAGGKLRELVNSDSRLHMRPIDAPSVSAYSFVSCNAPKDFSFKGLN